MASANVFKSFDEMIGYIFEAHQSSDNNPLDGFVQFEMPDGLVVKNWTVVSGKVKGRKKLRVVVSDR